MVAVQHIIFDKDKTQIIKGIAILTMIIHHCIAIPTGSTLLDMFGASMKICISYFTFLVGFGYAFSKQKTIVGGLYRAFKLLLQFWLLLIPVFIPLYVIDGGKLTAYQIITNLFGLESDLHYFSWYLYYYIYAMIVMPFASKIMDKWGWKALIGCIVFSFVLECSVHIIPNWNNNIFTQAAFDCFFNSPLLFLGYYMARYNSYSRINLTKKHTLLLVLLFVLVIAAVVYKRVVVGFMLDFIYVPLILLSVLGIFTLYKLEIVRTVLIHLGDMSMSMWFIHALFIMPLVTASWINYVVGGNPWLKFVIVVPLSYLLAFLYDKLTRPIVKRI